VVLRLTCPSALGGLLLGLVAAVGCSKVQRDFGPLPANGGAGGATGGSGGAPPPGGTGGEAGGGAPNANCGAWAGKLGAAGRGQAGGGGGGAAAGASGIGGAGGRGGATAGGGAKAGAGGVGGGVPGTCALASCTNTATPLLTLSTLEQTDSFALGCGNGTAPDVSVLWTAPASGWYRFSTTGSSFDTVLGLLEPSCGGPELECGNDVGNNPESKVFRSFAQGETVLVVVDGNYGDRGTAVLNVELVTCPSLDLTGQPLPAALTTVGGTNNRSGACGGDGQLEKSYRWIPPSDGLYRFSATSNGTTGSSIHPALYLERGPECGGELLGCNAASGDLPATVTRWLPGRQPVTVIVDAQNGPGAFSLNVEKLSDACPVITGGVPDGDIVLDSSAPDILSPSCVQAPAEQYMGPTHEHSYLLPAANCGVAVTGDGPFTVYLLKGDRCDGPEMGCQPATGNVSTWSATVSTTSDYDSVLVIEQGSPGPLTYSVHFMCTMG
jgi:hypothetical protein